MVHCILFDHSTGSFQEIVLLYNIATNSLALYRWNNVIMDMSYDYFHVSYNFLR